MLPQTIWCKILIPDQENCNLLDLICEAKPRKIYYQGSKICGVVSTLKWQFLITYIGTLVSSFSIIKTYIYFRLVCYLILLELIKEQQLFSDMQP